MWKAREPRRDEITALGRLRQRYNLTPLVVHANYLINLASPDEIVRTRSIEAFRGEIGRAAALGAEYVVLHPGSFRNGSAEIGMRTFAESVRAAARQTPFGRVTLLIENTCVQGNTLGGTFEQLQDMLAMLDGVPAAACIDTAHCYAAGMDISCPDGLQKTVASLQQTIGLEHVKVIHTNDCRSALGSRHDRHEHIGKGGIGTEGFRRIVNHPALRDKTFILETPIDEPGDDHRNMQAILSLRSGPLRKVKRAAHPMRVAALGSPYPIPACMDWMPVRRYGKVNW